GRGGGRALGGGWQLAAQRIEPGLHGCELLAALGQGGAPAAELLLHVGQQQPVHLELLHVHHVAILVEVFADNVEVVLHRG
nr:hypothetical protein [Tanacetum cinerariifolium]